MSKKYTIGLDYGTDSVGSLIVDVETGEEISGAVFNYPRWEKGLYSDASMNRFRQHPKLVGRTGIHHYRGIKAGAGRRSRKCSGDFSGYNRFYSGCSG